VWSSLTTFVDMTYTAFLVPLGIAFAYTDWTSHPGISFLIVTDYIGSKSGCAAGDLCQLGCRRAFPLLGDSPASLAAHLALPPTAAKLLCSPGKPAPTSPAALLQTLCICWTS
jgi:hypothetical protein